MSGDLFEALEPELWRLVLGAANPGGSVTRSAKASHCPKCRAATLHGLDDDQCALAIVVDPYSLSALGEAQATLTGRRTVELRRAAEGWRLDHRNRDQVRGRPAGSRVVDVLAEHRCGTAPLDPDPLGPVRRIHVPLPAGTVPPF